MADIGGGGSTLPAKAYQGSSAVVPVSGPRLSTPLPGSLFYEALPAVTQSYCQTGSGAGRSIMVGSSGNTDASRSCPASFSDDFFNGISGFSAPSSDADFAASDAPASLVDFDAFIRNKGVHEQLVQFPALAGSITVIARSQTKGWPTHLTEAELCNIFSGKITNWNQLVDINGRPFHDMPITIVYRSDNSGTSFSFSNHLNKVCQDASLAQKLSPVASPLPFPSGSNFTVQSLFANAFPGGVVPAHALAASGNAGMLATVSATDGTIGYAETAYLRDPVPVTLIRISPFDPASELDPTDGVVRSRRGWYIKSYTASHQFQIPSTFTDVDGSVLSGTYTGRALSANDSRYGRPVGVPTALTATQAPHPNCVFLVHPGAYATSAYNTAGSPSSGYKSYPIIAISYLLGNFALNGNANDMASLIGSPYNVALRVGNGGPVTSIWDNTGYYYLTAPVVAATLTGSALTLNQARVDACVN